MFSSEEVFKTGVQKRYINVGLTCRQVEEKLVVCGDVLRKARDGKEVVDFVRWGCCDLVRTKPLV